MKVTVVKIETTEFDTEYDYNNHVFVANESKVYSFPLESHEACEANEVEDGIKWLRYDGQTFIETYKQYATHVRQDSGHCININGQIVSSGVITELPKQEGE